MILISFLFISTITAQLTLGPIKNVGRITQGENGFDMGLSSTSEFGRSVSLFDDLDGDGVRELVVSTSDGVLYLLWMNGNYTVKHTEVIDVGKVEFGSSVCAIDDLDGDGISELLVGGETYDQRRGAFFIVWIDDTGGVKNYTMVAHDGFGTSMSANAYFGISVAMISDLDGDGINEIAVGAIKYNSNIGCVFIMFIDKYGTITSYVEVTNNTIPVLSEDGAFGASISLIDDLDGDGIREIAVGQNDKDPVVYIIFLNSTGIVKNYATIGPIGTSALFGSSVTMISDLDNDGIHELAFGAPNDTERGSSIGALWIVKIDTDGNSVALYKISSDLGANITFPSNSEFGVSVSLLTSPENPLSPIVVGTSGSGALWILEFEPIDNTTIIETTPQAVNTTSTEEVSSLPDITTLQGQVSSIPEITTLQEENSIPETTELGSTTNHFEEIISSKEIITATEPVCQTFIPCIETTHYCICPDKCPEVGICKGTTSDDVIIQEEAITVNLVVTVNSLSLKKSVLNVDSSTRIYINQDLLIDDSTLTSHITDKEKEMLENDQRLDIISVGGNIKGTFNEMIVMVDGEVDSDLEIVMKENHFYIQKKRHSIMPIILITTIASVALLITLIILFTNKKFKQLLMNKEADQLTELGHQQSTLFSSKDYSSTE